MTAPDLVRWGATTAALLLAVTSQGDALVLAAALAVAVWRPVAGIAVAAALVATSWRWGSSSLEAIAGAQAVLGPAGWVGPSSAAAASWLAAVTVVAAAPATAGGSRRGLAALASGAAAAVVVAGPAPGGDLWVRVVAGALAAATAWVASGLRARGTRPAAALDGLAAVAATAALVAASRHAPGWSGVVSTGSLREGVAVAMAGGVLLAAVLLGRTAMEHRLR